MLGAAQGLVSFPPIVLFIVVFGIIAAGLRLARREHFPATFHDREDLSSMSWTEVSRAVSGLFERQGFSVNPVRRKSAAGVDMVLHRGLERVFVRADYWKVWTVGAEPLHRLYQAMRREGADHGVVLTAGEFTPDARDYAAATGLELVDGSTLSVLLEDPEALDLAA